MIKWQEYKLEDVIEKFIDYRGKTPNKTTIGVPLITAKIVKGGRLMEPNEFISEIDYPNWMTRGFPEIDDLIITTEAPLGEVALIKNKRVALAQRIITLQTKKSICDSRFLKYYFQSEEGQQRLHSRATGTTVEGIKSSELKKIEISLPPFRVQQSIAEVLSSLDDKIDLLHKQNKTLEALAETLFDQYFIEEAEYQSNNKMKLGDLIDTISKTYKFIKPDVVFLNTSDIYKGQVLIHSHSKVKSLPGQAKKSIQRGDILFSEIRPANGRWAYINFDAEDYVVSTKLMVLRAKSIVDTSFIYFFLTHSKTVAYLQMLAESRSGTFPQITFDQLIDIKINIPSQAILNESISWCKTAIKKINSNQKQIQTLETLRNNLLPKLMSGAVTVSSE